MVDSFDLTHLVSIALYLQLGLKNLNSSKNKDKFCLYSTLTVRQYVNGLILAFNQNF